MADPRPARPWLKLWISLLTDPDFNRLGLLDQARWLRLFLHIGAHGEGGQLVCRGGSSMLAGVLHLHGSKQVRACLARLPNIMVEEAAFPAVETTITFRKWAKYQEDSSTERTRAWRKRRQTGDGKAPSQVTTTHRHGEAIGDGVRGEKRREEPPYPRDPDTNPAHIRFNIPDR